MDVDTATDTGTGCVRKGIPEDEVVLKLSRLFDGHGAENGGKRQSDDGVATCVDEASESRETNGDEIQKVAILGDQKGKEKAVDLYKMPVGHKGVIESKEVC